MNPPPHPSILQLYVGRGKCNGGDKGQISNYLLEGMFNLSRRRIFIMATHGGLIITM